MNAVHIFSNEFELPSGFGFDFPSGFAFPHEFSFAFPSVALPSGFSFALPSVAFPSVPFTDYIGNDIVVAIVAASVILTLIISVSGRKTSRSLNHLERMLNKLESNMSAMNVQLFDVRTEHREIVAWMRSQDHAMEEMDKRISNEIADIGGMFCSTDGQIASLQKKMMSKKQLDAVTRNMVAKISAVNKKVLAMETSMESQWNVMDETFAPKSYVDNQTRTLGKKTYEMFYRLYVGHQAFEDAVAPNVAQSKNVGVLNNLFYHFEPQPGPFRTTNYPNFIHEPVVKLALD